MQVNFKTTIQVEGLSELSEEQRVALLDEIVGQMSRHDVEAWIAASRWRGFVLEAAIAVNAKTDAA